MRYGSVSREDSAPRKLEEQTQGVIQPAARIETMPPQLMSRYAQSSFDDAVPPRHPMHVVKVPNSTCENGPEGNEPATGAGDGTPRPYVDPAYLARAPSRVHPAFREELDEQPADQPPPYSPCDVSLRTAAGVRPSHSVDQRERPPATASAYQPIPVSLPSGRPSNSSPPQTPDNPLPQDQPVSPPTPTLNPGTAPPATTTTALVTPILSLTSEPATIDCPVCHAPTRTKTSRVARTKFKPYMPLSTGALHLIGGHTSTFPALSNTLHRCGRCTLEVAVVRVDGKGVEVPKHMKEWATREWDDVKARDDGARTPSVGTRTTAPVGMVGRQVELVGSPISPTASSIYEAPGPAAERVATQGSSVRGGELDGTQVGVAAENVDRDLGGVTGPEGVSDVERAATPMAELGGGVERNCAGAGGAYREH